MSTAEHCHSLLIRIHAQSTRDLLPTEAAYNQLDNVGGVIGSDSLQHLPQLIDVEGTIKSRLVVQRVDQRFVSIAEEDVETSTKPDVTAPEILGGPASVFGDAAMRIPSEILTVVPPLGMHGQLGQLRDAPHISQSLARKFTQIVRDRHDGLEPFRRDGTTICIHLRDTNRHKASAIEARFEIKRDCYNRHRSLHFQVIRAWTDFAL
jgi:hypothetical protein